MVTIGIARPAVSLQAAGKYVQRSEFDHSSPGKSVRPYKPLNGKEQYPRESVEAKYDMESRAPRVGHKKSRKGCAQCKRRHVKCDEEKPCANCVRHGVACSLAGGPYVPREDAKNRRTSSTTASSSASISRTASHETSLAGAATSGFDSQSTSPGPSPLFALTGLIERRRPAQEKDWMIDLRLMHHYMTHTRYILTEHHDMDYVLQVWQVEMPKVAFSSDYVMHGLLGFSALHKALLEPDDAEMLRACAVDHLDRALVLYRSDQTVTTAENANAKFIFTWIVALFAYAIPPTLPPIDAMVELISLVKGIDAILSETWFWVAQGPFAPILNRGFQEAITLTPESYPLPEGMDFGLNHLDYMLSVDVMLPDDRRVCAINLAELKQVYENVLQSQGNYSIASILCFPKQESAPFAQLIKRRLPQALILLAYYSVLLDVLDARWWIHGWAARVLRDVLGSLEHHWRHWIEWPVQCILLKEHPRPGLMDAFMV